MPLHTEPVFFSQNIPEFPYNLKAHAFHPSTGCFFAAMANPTNHPKYSLAYADRYDHKFIPLASEKATVNNTEKEPNPLHGNAIRFLTLASHYPIAVTRNDPQTAYCLYSYSNSNYVELVKTDKIADAQEQPGFIMGLAGHGPTIFNPFNQTGALVAVSSDPHMFGTPGSGIGYLQFINATEEEQESDTKNPKKKQKREEPDIYEFRTFNAQSGVSKQNKAVSLDNSSHLLSSIGQAQILNSNVKLYWDSRLNCTYIPLSVISTSSEENTLCSVVVATFSQGKVTLRSLAPLSALHNSDKAIIGSHGIKSSSSIDRVSVLHTTTGLSYLVAVTKTNDNSAIFALPLVNGAAVAKKDTLGTLASKH
ncbi:MAG TPA: hypothetical protein VHA52_07325, partial [Candidatus Babeliaceae bacterium]|nr:hypothetical protein [Candidatus Babeliaceae bacterium]